MSSRRGLLFRLTLTLCSTLHSWELAIEMCNASYQAMIFRHDEPALYKDRHRTLASALIDGEYSTLFDLMQPLGVFDIPEETDQIMYDTMLKLGRAHSSMSLQYVQGGRHRLAESRSQASFHWQQAQNSESSQLLAPSMLSSH